MLNTSEQYVKDYLADDSHIQEILVLAKQEIVTLVNGQYYQSKQDRYEQWVVEDDTTYEDLLISIFTTTLLSSALTYQAVCGMLNHKIRLPDVLDRVKTIAEVLAVVSRTGLIHIRRQGMGESTIVTCGYEVEARVPTDDRHELNKYPAQQITTNNDDILGSMLLGGSLNHHEEEVCLEHLNLMNRIPLTLNVELLKQFEELPTFELDTPDKKEQWKLFKEDSIHKYLYVVNRCDNRFYMDHKWCTRGRCYALGYHISTQGTSYKKAITQLYNKELVTDEIS